MQVDDAIVEDVLVFSGDALGAAIQDRSVERSVEQDATPPMTLLDLVERCEWSMRSAGLHFGHGTDNAFDESAWLVAHVLGIDLSNDDDLPWQRQVTEDEVEAAVTLLKMRLDTRRPLAYLINEAWFAGERFYVDERVIVPRSHLGEWIREQFRPWVNPKNVATALDLCTGSGCIAIALAKNFPQARVIGTDLSADALEVASRNVRDHQLESRVSFRRGDLFDPVDTERFDLIVSNPPYVSDAHMRELPEEYRFEPTIAFAGGDSGLDLIDRILAGAASHLHDDGLLVVEAGSAGPALESRYPKVPFTWLSVGDHDTVVFMLDREVLQEHFVDS